MSQIDIIQEDGTEKQFTVNSQTISKIVSGDLEKLSRYTRRVTFPVAATVTLVGSAISMRLLGVNPLEIAKNTSDTALGIGVSVVTGALSGVFAAIASHIVGESKHGIKHEHLDLNEASDDQILEFTGSQNPEIIEQIKDLWQQAKSTKMNMTTASRNAVNMTIYR